jgi:hypothetical protein
MRLESRSKMIRSSAIGYGASECKLEAATRGVSTSVVASLACFARRPDGPQPTGSDVATSTRWPGARGPTRPLGILRAWSKHADPKRAPGSSRTRKENAMSFRIAVLASITVAIVATWAPVSTADEVVYSDTVYVGPNRALLWGGVVTLGVPYTASVIVAAESSRSGDKSLYIPIAGPWVDLVQRSGCPVALTTCNSETLNKVLLVGDGIFQAVGTIAILSSFFVRHHRARGTASAPELHLAPMSIRAGSGLAVLGTF